VTIRAIIQVKEYILSSNIFDKLDSIFDFLSTAKGTFIFGVLVFTCFIFYSFQHPFGVMSPFVYYFGVIFAVSMLFKSALLQTKHSLRWGTVLLGVCFLVWAALNTLFRVQ